MTEPAVLITRPIRRAFPGRADQISRAREFTKRILGLCPVADDAVLLVSELATNALEHTTTGDGGQFEVTIYRDQTSVLVGVTDNGSDKAPAAGSVDPEGETGRGLGLVELLAHRWGHCGGEHGRTVWFELMDHLTDESDAPLRPPTRALPERHADEHAASPLLQTKIGSRCG
jgi:anti-sigma regulatory factor (Ser/Thr protein kinase)